MYSRYSIKMKINNKRKREREIHNKGKGCAFLKQTGIYNCDYNSGNPIEHHGPAK